MSSITPPVTTTTEKSDQHSSTAITTIKSASTSPPETGVTVSISKSTMDTTSAQTTLPADTSTNPLPTETTTIATTEPTMTTTAITTTEALTTTDRATTTTAEISTTIAQTTTTNDFTTTTIPVTTHTTTDPISVTTPTLRPSSTTLPFTSFTTAATTTTAPSITKTTTTTPYTTHYITTLSIITVTTIVPKTTIISGAGTTIYITETTTTPTPTVIPDPNQEPPPTLIDSNNGNGKSLQTWQIILIVVACLVVGIAIGAVILVGHIKRKRREMRFRRDSDLFGDGLGVVGDGNGSEPTTSGGTKSTRTLIAPDAVGEHARWSNFFKFKKPWDSLGGYHGASQRHSGASGTTAVGGGVGGIGGNNGTNASGTLGPGGLWLMEENQGHYQDEAVIAAAAMYPVSYQNDFYAGLGDGLTPDMAEIRHAHYQQQEQDQRPTSSAMYPAISAQYSPTRLSPSLSNQERSISRASNVSSGGGGNIAPSPSPGLLQPLLEERLSDIDYIDGQGFGQTQKSQSQRESLETDLLTVSSRPESRVADNQGESNRRAPVTVDPAQLESNALFEHVRASPQAIPGDSGDSNVAVAENTTTTNT
ncbi:hypothetical protein BGZ46_003215 [Entomortierella lignicola]|nr:hypothetical protein BGZ46_003215 [Entomortierella lignicola]